LGDVLRPGIPRV